MKADAAAAVGGEVCFGLLRAGGALLALAVDALQEVISCPPLLHPLPGAAAGVCGAVRLRGMVIPVLDLRVALNGSAAPADVPGVIVLMRHGGCQLGLRADAVQGMAALPRAALQPLLNGGAPAAGIATHAFEIGADVATVLDAARLTALPQVPMVPFVAVAQAAASPAAAGGSAGEPVLLLQTGGVPLALAAAAVGATVPAVALRDSALRRDLCLGVFEHHGVELPVLHTGALLGLAPLAVPETTPVLVLRTPAGEVGLAIDGVSDIVRIAGADIRPAPRLGLQRPALCRGMLDRAGGPYLLLAADALAAEPAVASLATLGRRVAGPAEGSAAGDMAAGRGRPFITYHAGVETASPLAEVSEIIAWPASTVNTSPRGCAGRGAATLGLFAHRGAVLPLLDLPALLGRATAAPGGDDRVLIVEAGDGERVGFRVEALGSIEPARWEQAGGAAAGFDLAAFAARPPLVELGRGDAHRTLARLDLRQLALSLH